MNTRAIDEFADAGGSIYHLAKLLRCEPDTIYRFLAGDRQHYDLEHALTQDIGAHATARVLALIRGTGVDDREVWLEAKRCARCKHLDFFPIHSESITGRTLWLECNACQHRIRIVNQPARNRTPQRPDIDTATLASQYQAGATLEELANLYNANRSTIRRRLVRDARIPMRLRPLVPPEAAEKGRQAYYENKRARRVAVAPTIAWMRAEGFNYTAIGRAVGLSRETVKRILREEVAA